MKNKFLLIGPRFNKRDVERRGGVTVLFEDLISYCDINRIDYIIIDTNKANYFNKPTAYLKILFLLILKTNKVSHVSLHGTGADFLLIAPFSLLLSKVFSKQFILRKFADSFIGIFESSSRIKKKILVNTLHYSNYNFFETKYLVNYFKKYNDNTFWFPNVRMKQNVRTDKIYKKKFLFIGAVSKEKGIDILCEAAKMLSSEYEIDIYGALHDGYNKEYFESCSVNYRGKLRSEDVIPCLIKYDVLILPSFREGYPGVIIEALSVGVPVIATNLKGIREMIDESSSVFVETGNIKQLKDAIESFDKVNYIEKSMNALIQFQQFDTQIQTKEFFKQISC